MANTHQRETIVLGNGSTGSVVPESTTKAKHLVEGEIIMCEVPDCIRRATVVTQIIDVKGYVMVPHKYCNFHDARFAFLFLSLEEALELEKSLER